MREAQRWRFSRLRVLAGLVLTVAASSGWLLAACGGDSNGQPPSRANGALACANVTTRLDEEQPEADGARIFRVTVGDPKLPCLFGGSIVLFPNDAIAPSSATRIAVNDTVVLVPELLTDELVARYRWTNWCGRPAPLFLRTIVAGRYAAAGGGAYLLTDHSPRCRDESAPSVFKVIRADAESAPPPLVPTTDEGGLPAPPCANPTLAIQSFGPHEPVGHVSMNVNLSSESSCRLFGNVSIELLDAAGQPLTLTGNPASMPLTTAVGPQSIAVPFQWSSWCGTGEGISVRAAIGGSTVTDSVAVPRCSGVSRLRAGW